MSGGSMDYLYARVMDARFHTNTPERVAFYKHLMLVADALKAVEWVDSGDWALGDENEPILCCISPSSIIEAAVEVAEKTAADLLVAVATAQRAQAKLGR